MTAETELLLQYEVAWKESLAQVDADTKIQLDTLQTDWTNSIGFMTAAGIEMITKFKLDWFGEIATIVASTQTQMRDLKKFTDDVKPVATAVASVVKTAVMWQ